MVSLERARRIAESLAEVLAPACERLEVAGSIRRRVEHVKDIELVARPRGLLEDGALAPRGTGAERRMGKRYKALLTAHTKTAVDLFIVLPPAEFGAIHAIRTGPADFSRALVTACKTRGLNCVDGRLVDAAGRTVETPTEHDFFRECGVAWIEPEARR